MSVSIIAFFFLPSNIRRKIFNFILFMTRKSHFHIKYNIKFLYTYICRYVHQSICKYIILFAIKMEKKMIDIKTAKHCRLYKITCIYALIFLLFHLISFSFFLLLVFICSLENFYMDILKV